MKYAITIAVIVLSACATTTPGPAAPAPASACFTRDEVPEAQNPSQVEWLAGRELETFLQSWTPQRPDERLVATTQLRLLINENGTVQRATVEATSGHASLDEAAVRVGRAIRYGPAEAAAMLTRWMSLDVTFCAGPHELLDVAADRIAILRTGEMGEEFIEVYAVELPPENQP